jgi:transposase
MALLGIDLHTDSFLVAKMNDEGKIKLTKYYFNHGSFQQFKDQLSKEDYVLIEACTNSFWFYDQIIGHVKECYIC